MTNQARIRVALLMDHPSPHMVGILNALARRDELAAQVVYFRPGAPERTWGDPPGDLPFRIAASSRHSSVLVNVPAVLRAIANVQADIWVVNSCYTAPETWAAIQWLNRSNIPWVYMNERVLMRGYSASLKRPLLRLMLNRVIGIVGMGREAQTQYCDLAHKGLPSTSVPYYLDLNEFFALAPPEPPEPFEPIRFITAARMIYCKAYDILLAACSQLPDAGWTLTIAGDGPLRPKLERSFRAQWDPEKVRFLGEIPYGERANMFVGHHVFVFPSRGDGWGMAPVEAMAAGLAVISSDQVMSMREFIREGENGYLVASESSSDLAERMRDFISTPARISRIGLAARSSLVDYKPETGAEKLTTFLIDLLQNTKRCSLHSTKSHPQLPQTPLTWRNLTEPKSFGQRLHKHGRAQAKRAIVNASLALRPRFAPRGNRILVYHLVLPEDRARFDEHLSFLKDHYQIVTARELAKARRSTQVTPLVAITFDDGFRVLMSDALELLEKHGVKATFYVPTGFIRLASDPDRAAQFSLRAHYYRLPLAPMSIDDLRKLRDLGHEVGSHGVSHISLNAVSRDAATCELQASRDHLASWLAESAAGFAYPYGHTNCSFGQIRDWVASAGYEYAVTLRRGPVDANSDPMQLRREHAEGSWRVNDLTYFLGR